MAVEKVSSVSTTSEENERLLGFSDALFAIAMTFLALDLGGIPTDVGTSDGPSAGEYLTEHLREYGVYFVTFAVVGVFWLRHHLIFRYVKKSSGFVVWINIAVLALVAALPYPAGLFAEASEVPLALIALLVPLLAISVLLWVLWEIANWQGLAIPGLPRQTFISVRAQLLLSPVFLAIALGLAYIGLLTDDPVFLRISVLSWVLLLIAPVVAKRIWREPNVAYEVDEADLDPDWRSSEQFNSEQEEQSRSILARIRGGSDADRIKVLTDGIVAIAVTILALQLKPPATEAATHEQVAESLAAAPIWTYWITFVYISLFWIAHVRVFRRVRGSNSVVLWLNLIFLMFISFMPMPSALMSQAHESIATALYLGVLFCASLSLSILGSYAVYRLGLQGGYSSKRERDLRTFRSVSMSVSFGLAFVCVLVFDNPEFSNIVWIILLATMIASRRLRDDKKPAPRATST